MELVDEVCPVVGFGTSGVEPSGSTAIILVGPAVLDFINIKYSQPIM
jgi:hypothetical protein